MGRVPVALDLPGKSRRIRVEPLRPPVQPKPVPERAPAAPAPVKEPAQPSRSSSSAASVSKPPVASASIARS
jgi:hypothetical protein